MSNEKRTIPLGSGSGQSAYLEPDGALVVEFYNFGEDVSYEFADMLKFNAEQQVALGRALGIDLGDDPGEVVLDEMGRRFASYHDAKAFIDEASLPHSKTTDFWP